jgi:choline dehydrogenase-like flavoprotein
VSAPDTSRPGIEDPIRAGLARGWRVNGGPHGAAPETLDCDVAVVGSGAGAGITAELLAAAGLGVVIIEEGPLRSSSDFRQLESEAYPELYQESASRKTADKAIGILQGRCVGGSTTVNWTSSFRTPSSTLQFWRQRFELPELTDEAMSRWFFQAEQRLNIGPWLAAPNANNQRLRDGAMRLGISAAAILRNVKGCWNLGSCGMGCPTNAKQSMLVTTLPAALDRGARLLVQMRAERLELSGDRVSAVVCQPVHVNGATAAGPRTRVLARHVVVAGGAINSPALLMRSRFPDPHQRLGRRTFLHPVVASAALFDEPIEAWNGAPQTIYSDHFLDLGPIDGPMGYKLESPPLHPVIASTTLAGFGLAQAEALKALPRTQAVLALLRDGFHEQSSGGRVTLRGDGSAVLEYPLTDYVFDGARRAFLSMAEIQFAAGARSVTPVHEAANTYTRWADARGAIAALPQREHLTRMFSAHVMGGCGIAGRADLGVVRPDGRHWQVANLSVHDGSLFPTSIGANPQLSVYGLVNKLATQLARELSGRDVRLGPGPVASTG